MRYLLSIVATLIVTFTVVADEPSPAKPTGGESRPTSRSWRKHIIGRDAHRNVQFEATEIISITDTREEVVVLVWDQGTAGGLRFSNVHNFAKNHVTNSVEEIQGGSFFRVEFDMPLAAKTREDAMKEARAVMPALELDDAQLTFVTSSVRRTTYESAWRDEDAARAWRTEIRSSLSPTLVESLERLRTGFIQQYDALTLFRENLLSFIYWGGGEPRTGVAAIQVIAAPPNCRFDSDMGVPCSEQQERRVNKAIEEGKVLLAY